MMPQAGSPRRLSEKLMSAVCSRLKGYSHQAMRTGQTVHLCFGEPVLVRQLVRYFALTQWIVAARAKRFISSLGHVNVLNARVVARGRTSMSNSGRLCCLCSVS
jgi:hypothetical protein